MLPRIAAWEALQAIGSGAYSEVGVERVFKKFNLTVTDKALVTELVFGAVRQRQLLDSWIDYLANLSSSKQPPLLRWLLHIGLYQIFFMDRIPASAAVNTAVEIAKKKNLEQLAPVVNAVLRKAIRKRDKGESLPSLTGNPENILAQKYSLPEWLAKELIEWRGVNGAETLAKSFNARPAIDLRVNCIRATVKDVQKILHSKGIESNEIKNCPYGLEISSGNGDMRTWPGYQEGFWSIQNRSAQLIAPLVDAKAGECILDVCAAPGGKTTHLAELMNDSGILWAVDYSQKRLKRAEHNADRLGLKCIKYLSADSTFLIDHMPVWKGFFHKILIDAPCSGLGTLSRNPDLRWRMSPSKIKELVALQSKLLDAILPLLKSGGSIIYSTCTINPDENHQRIKMFLDKHSCLSLRREQQIWPENVGSGDGFYMAILENQKK